jgi:hypothetical protein
VDRAEAAVVQRHPKEFWTKLVEEVRAGEAPSEVARRHRVREKTLRWWKTHLRRDAEAERLRFLPVASAGTVEAQVVIEVALGRLTLRIPEKTDVEYVAALVVALRSAC